MKLASAILTLAAGLLLACGVTTVDLGGDRPAAVKGAGGSRPDAGGPVTTSDCPALTEAEAQQIYGEPCGGSCAEGLGPPREVDSGVELEAITAGRWQTCSGEVPWSSDVIGLQLQAGCTVFLLHEAPGDAGVVEGVTPDDQGTFNVVETTEGAAVTRRLQLFFPKWTWTVGVVTTDCPHAMTFQGADGGTTAFSAFASKTPPLQ